MSVKLGVPSKGRLMEKTFEWFGARGVELGRAGSISERSDAPRLNFGGRTLRLRLRL